MTPTQRKALHRYAVAEHRFQTADKDVSDAELAELAVAQDNLLREFNKARIGDWIQHAAVAELGRVLSATTIPLRGVVS